MIVQHHTEGVLRCSTINAILARVIRRITTAVVDSFQPPLESIGIVKPLLLKINLPLTELNLDCVCWNYNIKTILSNSVKTLNTEITNFKDTIQLKDRNTKAN